MWGKWSNLGAIVYDGRGKPSLGEGGGMKGVTRETDEGLRNVSCKKEITQEM